MTDGNFLPYLYLTHILKQLEVLRLGDVSRIYKTDKVYFV